MLAPGNSRLLRNLLVPEFCTQTFKYALNRLAYRLLSLISTFLLEIFYLIILNLHSKIKQQVIFLFYKTVQTLNKHIIIHELAF